MKKWMAAVVLLTVTLLLTAQVKRDIQQVVESVRPFILFFYEQHGGYVSYQGKVYGSPQGGPLQSGWTGTGFLVHPDGYIITAGHVADSPTNEEIAQEVLEMFCEAYIYPARAQELGRELTAQEQRALLTRIAQEARPINLFKNLTC